jgi:hypothetical protein
MNIAAIIVRSAPHHGDCPATEWVKRAGTVMFAAAVAALEAWLRAPVQPILDGYLRAVLPRASSIAAVIFRKLSF